jgi:hypothetical protein
MEQHYKILKLAADGNLPRKIDKTSGLSVDIVRELIEAGYLKAIDASSYDGIKYLQTRITLSGREYLNELRSKTHEEQKIMAVSNKIRLFISHSSKDSEFVQALVEFLRVALSLSSREIRCTSIDGYRLPGGANTDQQLKQEVHEADAFIGVISYGSIKSLFLVFELGARWGSGRSLIPILAPGTNPNILAGPLAGINALNSENRSQLHQLISDLSKELGITPEPPSSYEHHIETILNLKRLPILKGAVPSGEKGDIELAKQEVKILKILAEHGDNRLNAKEIANIISENKTKTEYYLDCLLKKKLISDLLIMGAHSRYGLTSNGRAYLVENNII